MNNKNTGNSVLGGLVWKFGERVLTQGISFLVSLVLARMLSPEDYGSIALLMVFLNLSAVFINSGFATALIQKKDADDTDFSTMFFCSLGCSVLIYLVLFFAAPLVADFYENPQLIQILRVFALQVPISVFNSIQMAYVSRHMLFHKVFVASVANALVSGGVGIAMAMTGFGVWALVAQYITATLTNTVVLFFTIPWRPKLIFSIKAAKGLMSYGSKVLGAGLSETFFAELRSLIIGRVYSGADLAYYNKGYQIPSLITNNVSNAVVTVMFPALANCADDPAAVKQMARRTLSLMAYVLVPCMLGLAAVMEPLILLLFTEKWAQTIPFGQLLSVDLCISVFGALILQMLKAIGRSEVALKLEVWKKPVYLAAVILGVSVSPLCLAAAMVVYDCYAVFLDMVHLKKYTCYSLTEQFRDLLPSFGLSALMATLVWLIPGIGSSALTVLVKILAGGALYVAGSMLLRLESFAYLKNILLGFLKRK